MKNECLFCKIINGDIPSYTIYEDECFKVFLDINPKSNGEMLVVPKKHIVDSLDMDDETFKNMNGINKKMIKLLYDKMNCTGIQLCQNNGTLQEIKHYHMHIVPSYNSSSKMKIEDVYNILKPLD